MLVLILSAFAADSSVPPLVEASPVDPIPGVALTWTAEACALKLRVTNVGAEPIVIDWMQSTIADPGNGAVGLVPGTSSAYSVMINTPPTVAPVGGFADVWLFRRDRLPTNTPPGCAYSVPGAANVSLRIGDTWATQLLQFRPDVTAEAMRQAEVQQAALWARCAKLQRNRRTEHTWAWLALSGGTVLGGVGILNGLTDTAPSGNPDVSMIVTGSLLATGGLATFAGLQHAATKAEKESAYWKCSE